MEKTILAELKTLADPKYRKFNKKIVPSQQEMLGVRLPALRKIARRIAKNDGINFVVAEKPDIYEMIMLEGLVLSYLPLSFQELLPLTEKYLHKVDNWAQIDSTICDYKALGKDKEFVFEVVKKWLSSKEEFVVRAGLIVLLVHYVEAEYLQLLFELSQQVRHQGYYVQMGNAWLISVCMAKYPNETMLFFKENRLDDTTHNMAIQKSRESKRVSAADKAQLKLLKR